MIIYTIKFEFVKLYTNLLSLIYPFTSNCKHFWHKLQNQLRFKFCFPIFTFQPKMSTDNNNLEEMVEKTLESTGVLSKMRVCHIKKITYNVLWLLLTLTLLNSFIILYLIGWTSSKGFSSPWKRFIVSGKNNVLIS